MYSEYKAHVLAPGVVVSTETRLRLPQRETLHIFASEKNRTG